MLTVGDGIVTNANNAKKQNEEPKEKELIEMLLIAAKIGADGVIGLTKDNIKRELREL